MPMINFGFGGQIRTFVNSQFNSCLQRKFEDIQLVSKKDIASNSVSQYAPKWNPSRYVPNPQGSSEEAMSRLPLKDLIAIEDAKQSIPVVQIDGSNALPVEDKL